MGRYEQQFFVYIMTNRIRSVLYTGMTGDLKKRVWEHKQGFVDGFTKRYRVTLLMYYEIAGTAMAAIEREKQIKAGSRKKKEELISKINPEWLDLSDSL